MTRRHPRFWPRILPRIWLMTDERLGDALLPAVAALPRGAGIIFRHYALAVPERRALFEKVRRLARAKGLVLVLAGPPRMARAWRADGFHGRHPGGADHRLIHTAPAHNAIEMAQAIRQGADLVLLSPVHATRSHAGQKPLGRVRFGLLARQARVPLIALGGMTARRARALTPLGLYGWAGIDGLTPSSVRT